MSSFLEKFNIIYDLQFGFTSNYSTSHAVIHMTKTIRSALDQGKVTCGIFIDLQKAFDTVNHEILIKKLEHYGFRENMNTWFCFYLTGCQKKVIITGLYFIWLFFTIKLF